MNKTTLTGMNTPAALHDSMELQLTRVRGSRMLSQHAKRVAIAKAYQETAKRLEQMRQAEIDSVQQQRGQLRRRMFGHTGTADPNTVIVRRDAADRAGRIDDEREALRALAQAERDGDEHLAQAIASRAEDAGWYEALGGYAATRPQFVEDIKAYRELPNTDDTLWRMRHAAQFVTPIPDELQGVLPAEIDRLAQDNLDDDSEAA